MKISVEIIYIITKFYLELVTQKIIPTCEILVNLQIPLIAKDIYNRQPVMFIH